MKALMIHGKDDIRLDEVPTPEPTGDQVRVKMAFGGICGSDLHYYFEGKNGEFVVREPLCPGHEMSGTVDLDPSGEYEPGTPVTFHPATFGTPEEGLEDKPNLWPNGAYLGSASTWPHTQGAMSEYYLFDKSQLRRLPEGLSLKDAALAEPLAVGLHAIKIAGGVEGKKVLVSGSGPIGLLLVAAAVSLGAAEVTATDVLDGPLERAASVGATRTINVTAEQIPALTYDVAFEASGVPVAITPVMAAVRRAGTVVQVGMLPDEPRPINLAAFVSKEITYHGTFRFSDEVDQAVELLASDPRIAGVVTHVIPAEDAVEAFETAKNSQISGKVLVELWG